MTDAAHALPDVARSDGAFVEMKQWDARSLADQRARADNVSNDRASAAWPHGLLSTSGFVTTHRFRSVGLLRGTSAYEDHHQRERLRVTVAKKVTAQIPADHDTE